MRPVSSIVGRTGLVALQHVESSQTRDQTQVPCTGRQVLNHWATRDVLCVFLISELFLFVCSFIYLARC